MSKSFSGSFEVNNSLFMEPDVPIDGLFAVASGSEFVSMVDAVEELGQHAIQGVIVIIPIEYRYSHDYQGLNELVSKIPLHALLTFGSSSLSKRLMGDTHLEIMAREYKLPFCFAQKPEEFRGLERKREMRWRYEHGLDKLQGVKGSIVLSQENKRITVMTESPA